MAQRLCAVLEELGPTYIKIGQFFSTRADILPESFLNELAKLQDSVAPFSFEEVKHPIEDDFGRKLNEIFPEFAEQPMFSASIGQVHFARLISGQECVVKVRRPRVEETISEDIEVLTEISKIASKHIPELKQWNITGLLEEVGEHLKRQIDFIYEASMMEKMKVFYEKVNIRVPQVFWEYSSKRVLTMEKIQGTKIFNVSCEKNRVSQQIVKGLFQVLFETGYFHADLHPGNIMMTDSGEIAFVDFGLVGYLPFEKRKLLAGIISGVLKGNLPEVLPYIRKFFGISHRVPENFERDVGFLVDKYGSLPLKKIHLANIMYDLMRIARKLNIRLDSDVGLLAKNLMNLESICTRLSPSESMLELSKAYWQPLLRKGIFQRLWLGEFKNAVLSYRNMLLEFPENLEEFMRLTRERVETEQKISVQLDKYTKSIEHAGTKISISILILPMLTFLIIYGIQTLPIGIFLSLLGGFLVMVAILLRVITGKYNE
ncbi:MAG: AarF/UbiB family protein [bacterium]|nr:AarF/UbiB family protein [bacterium]